jgi:hypothetical protein
MPGMRERKLHMMGETKSSRGDYGVKGYKKGGKIPGYMGGGGVMGMETSYKKKDRRP